MEKYEIRTCKNGEVNKITKEYFCISYQEFCKEVCDCSLKIMHKYA